MHVSFEICTSSFTLMQKRIIRLELPIKVCTRKLFLVPLHLTDNFFLTSFDSERERDDDGKDARGKNLIAIIQ